MGKEEEDQEEEEDQPKHKMHKRCCNTPSRPKSSPNKSVQAFLSTPRSAPLKELHGSSRMVLSAEGLSRRSPIC
eukprot:1795003-Pyramimonas_sp.AAC.1